MCDQQVGNRLWFTAFHRPWKRPAYHVSSVSPFLQTMTQTSLQHRQYHKTQPTERHQRQGCRPWQNPSLTSHAYNADIKSRPLTQQSRCNPLLHWQPPKPTSAWELVKVFPGQWPLKLVGVLPQARDGFVLYGVLQQGLERLEALNNVLRVVR